LCKPASLVVTRNGKVFWSKYSDKHEEIIKEFKLHEGTGGLTDNANFVRVEISPKDGNLNTPVKNWKYNLDQDVHPDWYDAKKVETACRKELKAWQKQKVITRDCAVLKNGEYYIYGGTIQSVEGGTIQSVEGGKIQYVRRGTIQHVYGGTIQYVYGGTIQHVIGGTIQSIYGGKIQYVDGGTIQYVRRGTIQYVDGGTIQYVYGGTIQSVRGGTIQSVEGGTIQYVRGGTIVKVKSGNVIVYTSVNPNILTSSKAVMIDWSGNDVKVYVGKDKESA